MQDIHSSSLNKKIKGVLNTFQIYNNNSKSVFRTNVIINDKDFLNKVDITNQEKINEIIRAEKENELAYSRFNSLKKQQSLMITDLKLMKDENIKLVNEIRITGNKQSSLEEEVKMKLEVIEKYSDAGLGKTLI